ncbi:MAG: hypothetical protein IJ129_01545 [Ruminococcus sp.]|nr:hypothetical protein [Ruminococcus sp.]
MFGYVRPLKPYLRIYEYDTYKAVYCGLCKDMGRRFGFVSRMTLSYDLTFLALMELAVNGKRLYAQPQRCIAHPLKKKMCATCKNDLSYSSCASLMLTYHKLRDDMQDKGALKKLAAMALLPFFRGPYKTARQMYPKLAPEIERAMKLQAQLEKQRCKSLDRACEPTALMMKAVFGGISGDEGKKALLERFGYLLGRFIYMTDALDDVKEDAKSGSYNPFSDKNGKGELSHSELEKIRQECDVSVNLTLGELSEVYVQLGIVNAKDITDNIIYMGLKNVYRLVRSGEFRKIKKKRYHSYE